MLLAIYSNASYLSETNAQSRAAGHFYLTKKNDKDYNNGPTFTLSTIIKHVVALASDAEVAALFYNAQEAVSLCVLLEEMGRPQLLTLLVTDSKTAYGITTGTTSPNQSKVVNMCFH
eukprot:15343655-Ditylum_brightwellii.AAC.1